jgi:hypothetical protein
MTSKFYAARSAVLVVALAALCSCGGGGGAGGGGAPAVGGGGGGTPPGPVPTTPLALTSANAQDVAAGATLTGLGTSSSGVLLQSALSVQRPLPRTHILTRLLRQRIPELTRRAPIAALAQTTCSGGSAQVTSNGSTDTETFTACGDGTGATLDGTITLTTISHDPGISFHGTLGINLTFKQPMAPDITITGSNIDVLETINVAVDTIQLTGTELFSTTGNVIERLGNFTLVAVLDGGDGTETDDVTFTYANTKIGGMVSVTTDTPCVTNATANFPNTGVFSITGTGGSKIRVTINGDETFTTTSQVTIELDANGDGTFESTTGKNWAELAV